MGYKMNGSPAKLGSIQGTEGHKSALKQIRIYGVAGGHHTINKDGSVDTSKGSPGWSVTADTSDDPKMLAKKGMQTAKKKTYSSKGGYKKAWADMSKDKQAKHGSYEGFVKAADAWWGTKAGQKKATTDPKFKHRITKTTPTDTTPADTTPKYTVSNGTKTSGDTTPKKTDTYGTRTEAEQNLDVRQAKRGRKVARKAAKKAKKIAKATHGKDSAEFAEAKRLKKATKLQTRKRVLEAKKEDRRDDRGIFAGLRRGITKRRLKRVDKKIKERGGIIDDPALSSEGKKESLIKDQKR